MVKINSVMIMYYITLNDTISYYKDCLLQSAEQSAHTLTLSEQFSLSYQLHSCRLIDLRGRSRITKRMCSGGDIYKTHTRLTPQSPSNQVRTHEGNRDSRKFISREKYPPFLCGHVNYFEGAGFNDRPNDIDVV